MGHKEPLKPSKHTIAKECVECLMIFHMYPYQQFIRCNDCRGKIRNKKGSARRCTYCKRIAQHGKKLCLACRTSRIATTHAAKLQHALSGSDTISLVKLLLMWTSGSIERNQLHGALLGLLDQLERRAS